MVNVTKTFLPPIEEYSEIIKRIWDTNWLTNRGPLIRELEGKLIKYLGLNYMLATTNGTLPLQIALKLFGQNGEIITTPFSYVATTASIIWENCTPIFVDIDNQYLTIDESKIESAITLKTTAILATHVFGNPCNVGVIERIAKKHNLKVIYDGAHCFAVKYLGKSIFSYGDISTCSFHATKLFHTGEGGALFCNDDSLKVKLFYSHNFGHNGPYDFSGVGINAKISEFQAAMGLAVLPYIDYILSERKKVVQFYDLNLKFGSGQKMKLREGTEWNYSYYPIIFESEEILLEKQNSLNKCDIYPRRYFYPSLNTIQYSNGECMPISESISQRILCLPLSVGLENDTLEVISKILNS